MTFLDVDNRVNGNDYRSQIPGGGPAGMVNGKMWASSLSFGTISTLSNCTSAASPAVCGSAPTGAVAIMPGATSVTVNTSAVTSSSEIMLQEDTSLGTRLGVSCNTDLINAIVTARTAGTGFTIALATTPIAKPVCYSFTVVN
jgi:hypothetical protein